MKFKLNGIEWTIEEVDEKKMQEVSEPYKGTFWGLTVYTTQKVYLLNNLPESLLIQTLKHELTHVWIDTYAHPQNEKYKYHYEQVCEIVSKSNDFINEVVEKIQET